MITQMIEQAAFTRELNEVAAIGFQTTAALNELTELELILVGGGSADVILG